MRRIQFHTVSAGETPSSIAARYTGNPANSYQLIRANGHKPMVGVAGVTTFQSLAHGERLVLPIEWMVHEK